MGLSPKKPTELFSRKRGVTHHATHHHPRHYINIKEKEMTRRVVTIYPGGEQMKGLLVERYRGYNIYQTPESGYNYAYINPKDRSDYGFLTNLKHIHERINERTVFKPEVW